MDSLINVNYRGFTLNLEFHIEGDPHPFVLRYINSLNWPHGSLKVKKRNMKAGLEVAIIESWKADDDRELGLMFEDDIEVSPQYFDYILLALKNTLDIKASARERDAIVGISLNTPRFNEVNFPHRPFFPDQLVGKNPNLFLLQIPSSWGAVYFPWEWRKFLAFYKWRKSQGPGEELDTIPHAFVNLWRRSWKR
jgi:hypothetical protein